MSSKTFKSYHELDEEFKKSLTNITWYNTKQECINKGVYNMWIYINRLISNELFCNDLEYLVKIETCNKLGQEKTYIGLIGTVNANDVTLICFVNNSDLSNDRKEIVNVDIAHITSWYVLSSCYLKMRYDY